jgi:hypothetical protein
VPLSTQSACLSDNIEFLSSGLSKTGHITTFAPNAPRSTTKMYIKNATER